MQIGLGLGLTLQRGGDPIPTAPDYVEPVEDDIAPPAGDPVPPTDTPTDPDTDAPEPGFDPDFTAPNRIELADSRQTAIRTMVSPNTWAVSYIATPITGAEYFEVGVHPSTPRNATLAVGFTTLAMPLNGIPGELPGTIAWWSDGRVRANGATLATIPAWGRTDLLGIGIDGLRRFLGAKNCGALSAALGSLASAGAIYPFVAMYSTGARARFIFARSNFVCSLPPGFFPVDQVDLGLVSMSSLKTGAILKDNVNYTDAAKITSVKIGAVLREV